MNTSYIRTDGTPAHLDDFDLAELQTLAPEDAPQFFPDLSQQYEDIILGIEPMNDLTSKALEYLNRWTRGKLSTEATIANLDRLGWLNWIHPENYWYNTTNGELENAETN